MSQIEAAKTLGISMPAYNKLENGQRTLLSIEEATAISPAIRHVEPTLAELCFLARRRSGCLLSELEKDLGVTRPRYNALERVADPRIVAAWIARGFVFPNSEVEAA